MDSSSFRMVRSLEEFDDTKVDGGGAKDAVDSTVSALWSVEMSHGSEYGGKIQTYEHSIKLRNLVTGR